MLSVGNRGIKTGKNAFGVSLVVGIHRLGGVCAFADFTFDGSGPFDTGIGVFRCVLGWCALALCYRLTRGWRGFDARLWGVDQ
ncbi:hypothetical protein D3C80_2072740 [compost metagenome]